MREFLQRVLAKPISWVANTLTSAPDRKSIFESLHSLKKKIESGPAKKGFVLPFEPAIHKFIIFSDQHRGRKNGADDFAYAEQTYAAALKHYNREGFHLIALGDCEELWENTILQVMAANKKSFELEREFLRRSCFTKIFGNHDLDWEIDPLAQVYLKEIYGQEVVALEAVLLQTKVGDKQLNIFCTHGHQGDKQSDGNWFSKIFVSKIWAPLQSYLAVNPNTPAYDGQLKTRHNLFMYEWSVLEKNLILITGHTHQPVFGSLTHFERLKLKERKALHQHNQEWAEAIELELLWGGKENNDIVQHIRDVKPTYFNTGCCCYADGDITGIEIEGGYIRLIKWKRDASNAQKRVILEEATLESVLLQINR